MGPLTTHAGGLALLITLAVPSALRAQTTPPDLTGLSIEDLMNIEITSASRKILRNVDGP